MAKNRTESVAKGFNRPRPRKETIGADWGMVPAEKLQETISAVTLRGGPYDSVTRGMGGPTLSGSTDSGSLIQNMCAHQTTSRDSWMNLRRRFATR